MNSEKGCGPIARALLSHGSILNPIAQSLCVRNYSPSSLIADARTNSLLLTYCGVTAAGSRAADMGHPPEDLMNDAIITFARLAPDEYESERGYLTSQQLQHPGYNRR